MSDVHMAGVEQQTINQTFDDGSGSFTLVAVPPEECCMKQSEEKPPLPFMDSGSCLPH